MSHLYPSAVRPGRKRPRRRKPNALAAARAAGFPRVDNAAFDEQGRLWVYWSRGMHDWYIAGTCSACERYCALISAQHGSHPPGTICPTCERAERTP